MPKDKEAKAKPAAKGKEVKADEKKRGRSKGAKEETKADRSGSKSQKAVNDLPASADKNKPKGLSKSGRKSAGKAAGRGKKAEREESKRRSPSKSPAKAEKKRKQRESKGSDDAKKQKKAKKVKDPTAPKGACGAYIQFTTVMVPQLRAKHAKADGEFEDDPATGAPYKHTAFMALAGKAWGELDDAGKAPYIAKGEADKARWEREKAEHAEHGYYTRADGTKSNAGVSSKSKPAKVLSEDDEPVKKKQSAKAQAKAKKEKETLALASESGNSSD